MKILHLTLKKKWFDMIASGEKKEEYREIKPYWSSRLIEKDFTHICFRNRYSKDAARITIELKGLCVCTGRTEWGAVEGEIYFVLDLGKIIQTEQ